MNFEEEFQTYIKNSPKVKTTVHWWDLYNGHYVELTSDIQKQLFHEAISKSGSYTSLGKSLNKPRKIISNCSKLIHRPNVLLLKKLCDYIDFSRSEIERNILNIGKSHFKPNLPFKLHNESGVEIRAAFLSDGHVPKNPTSCPVYSASEMDLQERLIELCKIIFGEFNCEIKYGHKALETKFPAVIGTALELGGVPRGDKRIVNCYVPKDILTGEDKLKRIYLSRVFDDEGDVYFDKHGKRAVRLTRTVSINNCKDTFKLNQGKWTPCNVSNAPISNLIRGEQLLLRRLRIDAKIYNEGFYRSRKDKITTKWRIQIGQQDSVKRFESEIGFGLEAKRDKLKKLVNSYVKRKLPNNCGKNLVMEVGRKYYQRNGFFRYRDLSKDFVSMKFSSNFAGSHLKSLLNEGKIRKIERGKYVINRR